MVLLIIVTRQYSSSRTRQQYHRELLLPQVSTEPVSSDGSSGDAGKCLLERLFRVPGLSAPRERKVSGAINTCDTNTHLACLRGLFRLPVSALPRRGDYRKLSLYSARVMQLPVARHIDEWSGKSDAPSERRQRVVSMWKHSADERLEDSVYRLLDYSACC